MRSIYAIFGHKSIHLCMFYFATFLFVWLQLTWRLRTVMYVLSQGSFDIYMDYYSGETFKYKPNAFTLSFSPQSTNDAKF